MSNAAEPAPETAAIAITHLTSPGRWGDAIRISEVKQLGGLAVCLHLAFAVSWEMPIPAARKLLAGAAVPPLGNALWQIPGETRKPPNGARAEQETEICWAKRTHYTTLHYMTIFWTTLHHIALHDHITLHTAELSTTYTYRIVWLKLIRPLLFRHAMGAEGVTHMVRETSPGTRAGTSRA